MAFSDDKTPPALKTTLWFLRRAKRVKPSEIDAPPIRPFPGKAPVHIEGQLSIQEELGSR